jgi:hypothetical protein
MADDPAPTPTPTPPPAPPAPAPAGDPPISPPKVRKGDKSKREIELEIKASQLEDQVEELRAKNGELEAWAKSLGKTPPADPPKPAPAAKGMDWEKFANDL